MVKFLALPGSCQPPLCNYCRLAEQVTKTLRANRTHEPKFVPLWMHGLLRNLSAFMQTGSKLDLQAVSFDLPVHTYRRPPTPGRPAGPWQRDREPASLTHPPRPTNNTAVCRLHLYSSRLRFTKWKGSFTVTCWCRWTESQTGQFLSHPKDRARSACSLLYHRCPPRDGAHGRHPHRSPSLGEF